MCVSNLGNFFSFKYAKICNKIPYSCGTWKYPEIYNKKKICLFLQKEKNLSEHLFLGRSRWAKQTIYQ